MRVEVLSRIWITDKRHNRCKVKDAVYVHKYTDPIVAMSSSPHRQLEEMISFLFRMVHFIREHCYKHFKSVVFIDPNIHESHHAYLILICYLQYYGRVPWKMAYQQLKTITAPFSLSHLSLVVLDAFYRRHCITREK